MPALVRTKAELEAAGQKPRVTVPDGLGPLLRQIVEQEQGDLIAAIREEARATARADADARIAAAAESADAVRREALARVEALRGSAEALRQTAEAARASGAASAEQVAAAAARVTEAAGAMADRIAERLTSAVDERMADLVQALSILRGDVSKLQKKPETLKWVLGKVERRDGQIVSAEFVRVTK